MLHITNGESTKQGLEPSGVPGRVVSWDDVLHEGPTPLASGDEWLRVRGQYLASAGYGLAGEMARDFREKDDALEHLGDEDEVVFWFEHDLYDQLLLVRHLWWIGRRAGGAEGPEPGRTRFSMVAGNEYLGMLKPHEFPSRFSARREITPEQIELGTRVWTAYCGDDPMRLLPFAAHDPDQARVLPYLAPALRRLLEEFPAVENGLARSERQILEVLFEGPRSPEQAFVAASRLEKDIWMGDWSFWTIVKRLNAGTHPLLTLDVEERPDRLPSGALLVTDTGRRVLARRADHVALNGISRWIGGTRLTPERYWRWTGSSLIPGQPPAP